MSQDIPLLWLSWSDLTHIESNFMGLRGWVRKNWKGLCPPTYFDSASYLGSLQQCFSVFKPLSKCSEMLLLLLLSFLCWYETVNVKTLPFISLILTWPWQSLNSRYRYSPDSSSWVSFRAYSQLERPKTRLAFWERACQEMLLQTYCVSIWPQQQREATKKKKKKEKNKMEKWVYKQQFGIMWVQKI